MSAPIFISPLSMRPAPNHNTATLEALRMNITVGNITACKRPARSAAPVTSVLTSANRSTSTGSRTNARTTRIPVICSRSTRFTVSMRVCITRNCGTIFETTMPTQSNSSGTLTAKIHDSPRSSLSAMMMPPTAVIGAATSMVQVIIMNICTCCTSLVIRVMSDGAPNWPTSRAENSLTWLKMPRRTSRPKPIEARDP